MKEEYFKDFIWDNTVRATLTWLFVQVPFLNFPLIKPIIEHYVIKFTDQLYSLISMFIEVSSIKMKNKQKENLLIESTVKLKIIAQRNGINSQEYRDAYNKAHDDFSQLTRFDIVRRV